LKIGLNNMTYSFYTVFGIVPSIVWLLFYLRKDSHPESNRMILKIFFYGMIAALPAILIEMGTLRVISEMTFLNSLGREIITFLNIFIAVALVEEFLKYLVVRGKAMGNSELDEPLDLMLYMIISALGFAASENILVLFSLGPAFLFGETVSVTIFRFLGATFLHALCSGTLGYFLALSFLETKKRGRFILLGLTLAFLLHGLYNFSIIEIEGGLSFLIPIIILLSLAVFLTYGFQRLKKLKSICTI